eukprot:jgi/Orpsp1_1/1188789/evm.model.d7180000067173.1
MVIHVMKANCCKDRRCHQINIYNTKANVLFALDNSWSMLKEYDVNDTPLKRLNNSLSELADYMPDQSIMYYTVFSSSATDIESFTKENVPIIKDDEESHGTGFSAVFNGAEHFFETKNDGDLGNVMVLVTDGVPEYTQSERDDYEAMTNAIRAAAKLKKDYNVKIYVFNVNDLCDVNESVVDKGTKIYSKPNESKESNNSIMKLISSNYEDVVSEYTTDGNRGINIIDYNKFGDKYYSCIGSDITDWSNLFSEIVKDEFIDEENY